jgi:hypothetical protein
VPDDSLHILESVFSLSKMSESQRAVCARISEADARALVRYAYRECKGTPAGTAVLCDLLQRVEASDTSVSQWISEILTVYRWMETQKLRACLRDIIEYVSCACEGSALQSGHSIAWYLEHYGFQRAQPE